MKKLFTTAMAFLLVITGIAQKKWNQMGVSVGYDQANKNGLISQYAKNKLSGVGLNANYDKFWSWYGLGADVDLYMNQKSNYDSIGLAGHIYTRSGNTFTQGLHYTTSAVSATNLTRGFVGIGPSFKFQNTKNNLVVALSARAGFTYTNGSMLKFSTKGAGASGGFLDNMLTRNGNGVPGSSFVQTWGTMYHEGYNNDILGTVKGKLNATYYIKPKLGVTLGAYYNYYMGAKARYNYIDWKNVPASINYWGNPVPLRQGLADLNSYGVNLGVTYRMMKGAAPVAKTAKVQSSAAINVKDELTGQPIRNAEVTITSNTGKTYTATTNDAGIATFEKIENGNYTAKGILNGIATNDGNFNVAKSKGTATLIHNDPRFTVIGKAVNASNNQPEAGVVVNLKNDDKGSVKMSTSQGGTGAFSFQIESNSDYSLVGKKDSYMSNIEKISTKGLTRSQTLYVELSIGVEKVEKGKALTLNNIYYDLDKANIREDASSDLQKVITFLIDNPSFNVEIASHTDNRGADDYNLKLSQQRAQAVVDYLSSHGISASRLKATGFGESKLKNNCTDCTEAQHQENRRTELTVVN